MKQWMVIALTISLLAGCTTMQPIQSRPTDLSQHFSDGGALQPGDRIIIKTIQGKTVRLTVRSVREEVVYGDHASVPFADIASMEKRVPSPGKTAALVVAILAVGGGISYVASHSSPKFTP
jgi:hypothetical protein